MAKKKQQEQDLAKGKNGASRENAATNPALELEIEHHFQAISQFSNHLIVQADGESVYLSFFQVNPPFAFVPGDSDEEKVAALRKSGKMFAECVARVAVPKAKIGSFIESIRRISSRIDAGQGIEIKAK